MKENRQEVLKKVIENDSHPDVRKAAQYRLKKLAVDS
jgi:hypothetical protein